MGDFQGLAQRGAAAGGVVGNSPILNALQQLTAGGQQPEQPAAVTGGADAYSQALGKIESAGSGDYAAIGPTHPTLGRMLGRHQIAEANLGPWSQEALGRQLTPDEFLADPNAQEAVFKHKFGQYVEKYGPEGAARAWLGGEGNVNNPGAKDSLGTSVGEYGQKFMQNLATADGTPQRDRGLARLVDGQNGGSRLRYTNQGAQRKGRLMPELESALNTAISDVYGPGYRAEVYSGGQKSNKAGEGVGSTRHNHGGAGDIYIIGPDGKRLTGDGLAPIAQYWRAKGIGGVGLEMAGGGIHLDIHRDRAGNWDYGKLTPGQSAAIAAGNKGQLPQMYRDSMAGRMFGAPQSTTGGAGASFDAGGSEYQPGPGEQLQAQLRAKGRPAGTPRSGGGPRVSQSSESGSGSVDDSRRRALLNRAKEAIPPAGQSQRAAARRDALKRRMRGEA